MLISQQPCSKVVSARVRKWGLPKGKQDRRKSKKENWYMIKVVRFKQEGDTVHEVRQNQRMYQVFSLGSK
jgi:hypothetical protein